MKTKSVIILALILTVFASCKKEIVGPQGAKGDKGDTGDPGPAFITQTGETIMGLLGTGTDPLKNFDANKDAIQVYLMINAGGDYIQLPCSTKVYIKNFGVDTASYEYVPVIGSNQPNSVLLKVFRQGVDVTFSLPTTKIAYYKAVIFKGK